MTNPSPTPVGLIVTRLAEWLLRGDIVYVAADEPHAEAVGMALVMAAPEALVVRCPSSDALPGDAAPASAANVGRRVAALQALHGRGKRHAALVTTAEAAARLYPPPADYADVPPEFAVGQATEVEALASALRALGYGEDEQVEEPGMFAAAGQVVDLFPADAAQPVRVEVAHGAIVEMRPYDPLTQLGTGSLDRLSVGRVAEPPLGPAPVTLFDHLPGAAVALDPDVPGRRDRFAALASDIARGQSGRPPAIAGADRWDAALDGRERVATDWAEARPIPRYVEGRSPQRALLRDARAALVDGRRLLLLGAPRDLRFVGGRLVKALDVAIRPATSWADAVGDGDGIATLAITADRGWQDDEHFVVAAADVLGGRALLHAEAPGTGGLPVVSSEIQVGDVVIHEAFGVAVVAGLEPIAGDADGDALVLTFAADARRQVPVAGLDRLWRYGAEADAVTLDKLDGSSWQERRAKIDAAIAETARGLAALAAERAALTAPVIEPDAGAYERFAAGFGFTETADQARAIAAVRSDLASGRPVDRLVIGDVGYGKTEVALRAAALTALSGRQVAIAAPTTVLVRQHLETFRKRFAGTGINVAGLSRLTTPADRKATLAGLADGSVGIVVGTAAVAGKAVAYRELALVVIDEEQRFGAADKGRLRGLCEACHMLTLTATPIPRTLQSALIGLQQLSVIATPPARRQPIRTISGPFDDIQVRAALLREKSRRGQSFIVVPRIEDMAAMRERLTRLVPDLTLREAHGKMPAADIDAAMVAFAGGDGDVLLATNIIEAGLDVPRANTMIVWRADRFGLSQLHQLRGRVGRGGRRGQVLLLTDPDTIIAARTLKRLKTLETFDHLGAGFAISARDLDVRGAGDLLGDEQAGHVKLIGVDLYQHLLELALRSARGEPVDDWRPELKIGVAGRLPDDWIPAVDVRLPLYMRLARLTDDEELDAFEAELEDRFGALPEAVRTLLAVTRAGLLCRRVGIARIDAGPAAIALTPRPGFSGRAPGLIEKDGRLLLTERNDDPHTRLAEVIALLEALDDAC